VRNNPAYYKEVVRCPRCDEKMRSDNRKRHLKTCGGPGPDAGVGDVVLVGLFVVVGGGGVCLVTQLNLDGDCRLTAVKCSLFFLTNGPSSWTEVVGDIMGSGEATPACRGA
jgi:hypothetical protein